MAVEIATKISELNPLWPLGTDEKAEGDNHIRLIKSVLQATDGGALTGPVVTVVTATGAGTYTKPAGLKFLAVTLVGGGGGSTRSGITAAGQGSAGGGGGGGGVVMKFYKAADLAASEPYTIGAGGQSPGGVGEVGGDTTYKGLTAGGGGGGGPLLAATANVGIQSGRGGAGAASGGDLNLVGEGGDFGWANPHGRVGCGLGGPGGGNHFAAPVLPVIIVGVANGINGNNPGGGAGGGGGGGASGGGGNGGVGGNGMLMLQEWF